MLNNFRFKSFVISVIVPFLLLVFYSNLRFEPISFNIVLIITGIFYIMGLYWVMNFEVNTIGIITILLPPTVWVLSGVIFYVNYSDQWNGYVWLFVFGIYSFFLYYFVTTQNLLNINYFRPISLSQAAKTAKGFFTVILFFISTNALFSYPNLDNIQKISLLLFVFILVGLPYIILFEVKTVHFIATIFNFSFLIMIILGMFLLDFFIQERIYMLVVISTLIFKGSMMVNVYSVRDNLSFFDKAQFFLELVIIFCLMLYLSGILLPHDL